MYLICTLVVFPGHPWNGGNAEWPRQQNFYTKCREGKRKSPTQPVHTGSVGLSSQAHPAGVEPATFGSVDRRRDDVTGQSDKELRQTETPEVPTVVPSPTGAVSGPELPPDLARVVAAWDRLPAAIRAGVLAMVEAAGAQIH